MEEEVNNALTKNIENLAKLTSDKSEHDESYLTPRIHD